MNHTLSSYISSPRPFLKRSLKRLFNRSVRCCFRRCRSQTDTWCKRVEDGHRLLDQSFNPVTLSRRQTVCYRSFHYVPQLQIALKVIFTDLLGRGKRTSRVRVNTNTIAFADQRGQLEAGAGGRNTATNRKKPRSSLLAQSWDGVTVAPRLPSRLKLSGHVS